MNSVHYQNRYGDDITFTQVSDTEILMSGHNPEWLRAGWPNDYSDAYGIYLNQCRLLEEPDYDYLIDDPNTNTCRPMTYQEFANEVETNDHYRHYLKHSKSDKTRISMVDPSGGPYIELGTDIGRYFGDGKKRIVEEIEIEQEKIKLIISN